MNLPFGLYEKGNSIISLKHVSVLFVCLLGNELLNSEDLESNAAAVASRSVCINKNEKVTWIL